jgi:triphosphatase
MHEFSREPPALRPDMTIAEAGRVMFEAVCAQVDCRWTQVLDSDDAEGPHALRVGFRKLRVALHILREVEGDAADLALRKSIVSTSRHVGRLRDLDVLLGDIVAPLVKEGAWAGSAELTELIEHERMVTRAAVRKQLVGKPARLLRETLADLAHTRAAQLQAHRGDEKIGKLGRRDLRHRWRKVSAQAAGIETATAEELHDLRKALKNLRYAFAHFASFWEHKPASAFDAHLRALQSSFGYLNDVASAHALTARLGAGARPVEVGCAIGYVLGWHSARAVNARPRLLEQWQDLAGSKVAQELASR